MENEKGLGYLCDENELWDSDASCPKRRDACQPNQDYRTKLTSYEAN